MKQLDQAFNIESSEVLSYKKKTVPLSAEDKHIKDDYEYTRENLYNLIENGNAALEDLVELARATEHPRTYEVLSQLIKTIGDTSDKLSILHEKQKKLKESEQVSVTNNSIFVGSSSDLLDLLDKEKDEC